MCHVARWGAGCGRLDGCVRIMCVLASGGAECCRLRCFVVRMCVCHIARVGCRSAAGFDVCGEDEWVSYG